MIKNYKVNVAFITTIKQDDNVSEVKLDAIGSLVVNENHQKLYFQTTQSNQVYQMEIYINDGSIKIKQIKPNPSTLEFDSNKKTFATYTTDYGTLDVAIKTSKLVTKPGNIVIEYLIDNQNAINNFYAVEITYKELV